MNALVIVLVCLGYLVIIMITNRGLIAGPRKRLLLTQVDLARERATIIGARSSRDEATEVARATIEAALDKLSGPTTAQRRSPGGWMRRRLAWLFDAPLTQLAADLQHLNAVNRRFVQLVPEPDLMTYGAQIIARLQVLDDKEAGRLGRQLHEAATPNSKRIVIERAHELVHEREDAGLVTEFDHQRVSLWLALVGLDGVIAIGIVLGHEVTMLMGALGGFLAPTVSSLTNRNTPSSWGVRVLSPVGGALTAVGGLLLVDLLSDSRVNLLGSIFRDVWEKPTTPIALALALLFGFSGRLFSSMAIRASSQLGAKSDDG
ncbi:hypothetical protein ACLMAL_06180 [Nocardia sp. CWNU-33]|uniref:hypothetical protein n=1 Tax=Nocardia sp. CWNU-33 TaxID=3392117 RepID=UPI00398EE4F5